MWNLIKNKKGLILNYLISLIQYYLIFKNIEAGNMPIINRTHLKLGYKFLFINHALKSLWGWYKADLSITLWLFKLSCKASRVI